jgi:hypothetical protein
MTAPLEPTEDIVSNDGPIYNSAVFLNSSSF